MAMPSKVWRGAQVLLDALNTCQVIKLGTSLQISSASLTTELGETQTAAARTDLLLDTHDPSHPIKL